MELALFDGPVDNFSTVRISNVTMVSVNSSCSTGVSYLYVVDFGSSVSASPVGYAPSTSCLQLDNILLESASSTGMSTATLILWAVLGEINNFHDIRFVNITALSLNANSSASASLFLMRFKSPTTAPVGNPSASVSSSSSSIIVDNIRVKSASCTGRFVSELVLVSFSFAVTNYLSIQIKNISSSSLFTSSVASNATTCGVFFGGGLSNCSLLLTANILLHNTSSATSSPSFLATISLLSFSSGATYYNIPKIILQNSRIEQVSISSKKLSVVRIFDAGSGFQAESIIIIKNNSLLLFSSSPTTSVISLISQTISAAVVALTSPGFIKMEVANNILSILDQTWQEICTPQNCSIVRVSNVQPGSINNINNQASTISISRSEIIPVRSSFVSFANYASSAINNPLVNFVLEDNMANFPDANSASSLLGFDASPSSSWSFPPLVFVDVKCNRWSRIIDRSLGQQLFSIADSSSQVRNFIQWTCRSRSSPESTSQSSVATSSSSNSPSVMSSMSSSRSIIRDSVSPLFSETKTRYASRSVSTSSSVSSERSRSTSNGKTQSATPFNNPSPFILKISEPVNSALLVSDGTQAAAMVSVAVFASIASSPALGFTIGRQQAMMDFAQKSLRGDCRGLLPSTTVKNFEDEVSNPLGLGDSPTQLSIGGSEKLMSYYVGAVVGNCVMIVCLVGANQGIGMGALKFLHSRVRWIRKFVKKSTAASMLTEQCGAFNKKEPIMKSLRRVFAKSYVSLTLFFCLSFLLTPTLSSALIVLVAAKNDPELEGQQVPGYLKLVSLVCAIVFSIVALYFVIWSVKLRRKRKEKFRSLRDLGLESHRTERTIASWLFKARGEWRYPPNDQKMNLKATRKYETNYNDFLIAEPAFESYRTSVWFSIVEVATAIALAFPPFFAQFASSAKSSCMIQGIMLLVILLLYTTLLIWKNPFKLRILRMANPILSLQQLVIVVISLIFVAKRNGDDSNATAETPAWFWRILMVPLGFQSLMSVLMMGAAVFPILMFLKKFNQTLNKNRKKRRTDEENNVDEMAVQL